MPIFSWVLNLPEHKGRIFINQNNAVTSPWYLARRIFETRRDHFLLTSRPNEDKEGEEWEDIGALGATSSSDLHHFCSHSTDHNSVMWLQITSEEAEKCSLVLYLEEKRKEVS